MDAFGDNFVNEPEVDPAAEFLAREQDQLAGLEDEITPMAVTLAAAAAAGQTDGKQDFIYKEYWATNFSHSLAHSRKYV